MSRKADSLKAAPLIHFRATATDGTHRTCTESGLLLVCWDLDSALSVLDRIGGYFKKSGQFKGRTPDPLQGYRD
jgi:hypothetical protein